MAGTAPPLSAAVSTALEAAMPRLARQAQQATGCYSHGRNRGHNREVVFRCAEDRLYFLDLVQRYRQRFPWRGC